MVISTVWPSMRAPIVPKARPMSHWASEIGRTSREDLVGPRTRREVEVVDRPSEERVAYRTADESELFARSSEGAGQRADVRRCGKFAKARECGGDAFHAPKTIEGARE